MVDIQKIEAEIERLQTLNADEYLADEFAKLRADFEATREAKIKELESALRIFEEYKVVEEQEEVEEQVENYSTEYEA